eukprot:15685909-Heterocapsa_arctica.AAC.1
MRSPFRQCRHYRKVVRKQHMTMLLCTTPPPQMPRPRAKSTPLQVQDASPSFPPSRVIATLSREASPAAAL